MTKITDFRIGNYVMHPKYWKNKHIRIQGVSVVDRRDDHTGIYEEFIYLLDYDFLTKGEFESYINYKNGVMLVDDLEPILIDSSFLTDFGFQKTPKGHELKTDNAQLIFIYGDLFEQIDGVLRYLPRVKYLHQLQNFYHALTGSELERIN